MSTYSLVEFMRSKGQFPFTLMEWWKGGRPRTSCGSRPHNHEVFAAQVSELAEVGPLEVRRDADGGGRVRLTRRGRLLSNEVFQRFVGGASRLPGLFAVAASWWA